MEDQKTGDYKYLVRIANTDLNGAKSTSQALIKIRGINFMYANMVCNLSGVVRQKKVGYLTESEVAKLDDVLKNPSKYNVPGWMMNRRKDYETGEDQHLITSNLIFVQSNDIKKLKRIKSFRGMKLSAGKRERGKPLGVIKKKAAHGKS